MAKFQHIEGIYSFTVINGFYFQHPFETVPHL